MHHLTCLVHCKGYVQFCEGDTSECINSTLYFVESTTVEVLVVDELVGQKVAKV